MPTTRGLVLVADDNELVLKVVRRPLVRAGYEVVEVASGAALLRALERIVPELIVLDFGLPDIDGRELLSRLKADARTADIPVLVWSGGAPEAEREHALKLGAADYVQKGPASILPPRIDALLGRAAPSR